MINIAAISNPYPSLATQAQPAELNSTGRQRLDDNFVSSRPVASVDESSAAELRSDSPNALEQSLELGQEPTLQKPAGDDEQSSTEKQREARVLQQEQREIRELAARDREVRAHEQAHSSVGGQYAGAPQYQFQRGPDGVIYAVGGEVSIDVSQAATPEETIRKMQVVRRAALAPAEPSPQDRAVAAQAQATELQAKQELAVEQAELQAEQRASSVAQTDEAAAVSNTGGETPPATAAAAPSATISTPSALPPSAVQNRLQQSLLFSSEETRQGSRIDQRA
ncbi:putative metalloprotease CJM1_0395 family protein [Agaribacterium haliotis]|uniref:putative metalloprotease CJM1_0395 family protein n=1 Tax=Agaribacterium haliotis TaxID=2013869 RepID=UPI000BB5907E|nr:putative metalloprotease CJM1_0395 family protein [Agaribacterium haliotis]